MCQPSVLFVPTLFLEEKFNLTAEFCADIESHTNESIYTEVEKEVLKKDGFKTFYAGNGFNS